MKFKFKLHDRLIFLSLLPREDNFTTLRIVRKVSKDIGISDDEYKAYKIKNLEDGRIEFDPVTSQEEKEFEIGEIATQLVKTALEKLDKDKKLTQEHFPLYEKIVENSKNELSS